MGVGIIRLRLSPQCRRGTAFFQKPLLDSLAERVEDCLLLCTPLPAPSASLVGAVQLQVVLWVADGGSRPASILSLWIPCEWADLFLVSTHTGHVCLMRWYLVKNLRAGWGSVGEPLSSVCKAWHLISNVMKPINQTKTTSKTLLMLFWPFGRVLWRSW